MCINNHHPLPPDYLLALKNSSTIHLAIMGKDPYPTAPVGIPFCKPDWESQFDDKCSGGYVLNSLGLNPEMLVNEFNEPIDLFMFLAQRGIVFLNLSYHYIGGPIRKMRHHDVLLNAKDINSPILDRSQRIILCGEAWKNKWYDSNRVSSIKVCHPDNRNRINPNRYEEWARWWSSNALKNMYTLSI